MSWQEELRQLDEELAAGRVSSQDYRRRREELSKQGERPGPSPFSWDDDQPTTRMVRGQTESAPVGGDDDQPTTRMVRGQTESAPVGGNEQPSADPDPERTQIVPGSVVQASQGRPTYPVRSPWDEQALPPTTDLPPMWLKQGSEGFDQAPSKAKRVLGTLGVIVVLTGLTVGSYFLFKPAGGANSSPTTADTAVTTSTQHPLLARLPGAASDTSSVKTFDDVRGIAHLTNGEASAYQTGGVDEAAMGESDDGGSRIIVLVTRQASTTEARATRDALADLQVSALKLTGRDGEPGVRIAASDRSSGPLRRAHYSSERYVVRIQVKGRDVNDVQSLFDEVLRTQLQRLPADPAT